MFDECQDVHLPNSHDLQGDKLSAGRWYKISLLFKKKQCHNAIKFQRIPNYFTANKCSKIPPSCQVLPFLDYARERVAGRESLNHWQQYWDFYEICFSQFVNVTMLSHQNSFSDFNQLLQHITFCLPLPTPLTFDLCSNPGLSPTHTFWSNPYIPIFFLQFKAISLPSFQVLVKDL